MIRRLAPLAAAACWALAVCVADARAQAVFFHEDFAGFDVGDAATEWGPNSVVLTVPGGRDKRKFLSTQVDGEETIERAVSFPPNWALRFDVFVMARPPELKILLIDSNDNPIEIVQWRANGTPRFKMPNTVEVEKDGSILDSDKCHHVSVVRKDKTIKLFWDDELILASNYPNEGQIVRFKIKFKAGTYFTGFVGEERPQ